MKSLCKGVSYLKKNLTILATVAAILLWSIPSAEAETILYVPQDDRPVSLAYTVATARDAGYTVLTPPQHWLSGRSFQGHPDEIWTWVEQNVSKADVMVLSTDTLVYGGLVDSRKHETDLSVLQRRVQRIQDLKRFHPKVPLYAFGTVMRSPRASGGGVEPPYYSNFGPTIFQIAALQDKLDLQGLTNAEQAQLFSLTASVPIEYMQDWFNRRQKNMAINYALIDSARNHTFTYFALGHDDTSQLSQSAMEGRYLNAYSKGISATEYGSFPGADQLGLLLIARAHVDLHNLKPTFQTIYPLGGAEHTMPHYEDQSIGKTIAEHIAAIRGTLVDGKKPDILLAVNTPLTKATSESESFGNLPMQSVSTTRFVERIETAINEGVPVSVADIAYSNGSDNILLNAFYQKDLLYKLSAYNGWNTASNTVGYAIAQSLLGLSMDSEKHKHMLTQQYLDNWAYQANIRKEVYRMQDVIRTDNVKYAGTLNDKLESYMGEQVQTFAEKYLKIDPHTVSATFPWGRLFEVDITVHDGPTAPLQKDLRMQREAEAKAKAEAEAKAKAEADAKAKIGETGNASNSAGANTAVVGTAGDSMPGRIKVVKQSM